MRIAFWVFNSRHQSPACDASSLQSTEVHLRTQSEPQLKVSWSCLPSSQVVHTAPPHEPWGFIREGSSSFVLPTATHRKVHLYTDWCLFRNEIDFHATNTLSYTFRDLLSCSVKCNTSKKCNIFSP